MSIDEEAMELIEKLKKQTNYSTIVSEAVEFSRDKLGSNVWPMYKMDEVLQYKTASMILYMVENGEFDVTDEFFVMRVDAVDSFDNDRVLVHLFETLDCRAKKNTLYGFLNNRLDEEFDGEDFHALEELLNCKKNSSDIIRDAVEYARDVFGLKIYEMSRFDEVLRNLTHSEVVSKINDGYFDLDEFFFWISDFSICSYKMKDILDCIFEELDLEQEGEFYDYLKGRVNEKEVEE